MEVEMEGVGGCGGNGIGQQESQDDVGRDCAWVIYAIRLYVGSLRYSLRCLEQY